ncbi:ABC transporter permease [Segeticoccus rhizosphaerae]|uniref:ABC transporter permease n=1 Tax=Segeticoccus rhizosphaerae TaxID=1104777 RepID=UPI0010BF8E07|nr:ABC transporter permease [Ornithinicoccus soli]
MTGTSSAAPGRFGPVWLVATREIRTRWESKAWRLITLVTLIAVVGFVVVMKFVSGGGPDATVGYVGGQAVGQQITASGKATGLDVETRKVSADAGRQQVRDGDLDALVRIDPRGVVHVTAKRELGSDVEAAVTALAQQTAIHEQVTKLGGDPATFERAVAAAHPQVTNLEPPRTFSPDQLALGVIAGVLIYLSLMMNGQIVAQGVVEEKSSRVVELLLAAVRPWQLMAGKVLGIGLLGLAQMVVIAGGGAIAAVATGVLTISIAATLNVVVWLVVWFVLGFFAYALVFAAAGALVSRQEDVGGVVMPPLMLVILGYVIGVSVLPSDPANGVVRVLSWLPVFSPTLMPIRVAMGGVPAWELVLAVALIVLAIPGLIWLAARIYSNAVLRTGARVKVRDAFRSL